MKRTLLTTPFLFLFIQYSFAQEAVDKSLVNPISARNQIGFNIDMYSPTGEFARILDGAIPTGFGINYLRTTQSRWALGVELGVAMYYKAEYDLMTQDGPVPVYEEDCFWHVRGLARYNLVRTEFFSTYTEFRLGFDNFFSDVSATVEVEEAGTMVSHGWSMVAGVGLGADIGLGLISSSGGVVDNTYLSIRAGYNFGSPTYFRSAKVPSGQANDFNKYRYHSEISYLDVNLGVGWRF